MTTREVIEKYYECVNGGDWIPGLAFLPMMSVVTSNWPAPLKVLISFVELLEIYNMDTQNF